MATEVKPTTKNSPPVKTGANRNNLPADSYAGRYKEALPALAARPNKSNLNSVDMSVGAISNSAGEEAVKTSGIKIRGTGAATKGTMARGPMA
jgi:hypothetical protein